MFGQILKNMYESKAPRWFKVIRWNDFARRHRESWWIYVFGIIIPISVSLRTSVNPLVYRLVLKRPQDEEELMQLKAQYIINPYQQNWEMGQYHNEQPPPVYDLSQRRKKYPQYYEGRYDGFKRYDV